ncbi:MAG: hypothetical protein AAGH72_08085 [Verrucomicrobiota bacterium]
MKSFGLLAIGWATLVSGHAQLSVSLESTRDTFLLYEPMEFNVRLQNLTGSPIALQDHPVHKRSWLSFQIFGSSGEKIGPTGNGSLPPQVLKPGESKTLQVNITPLYKIRSTGQYDIRANVNIAGGQSFITGSIRINVGKGEVTWVRDINVDGVKRTYSLIRFLDQSKSSLYLRVEEVDKNLVYSTTRLGEIVGFTTPDVKFDSDGKIHLLHVSTSALHRYSRLTRNGILEYQEDRQVAGMAPALIETDDGGVQLAGGFNTRKQVKRKKLSEDQMGL